VSTTLSCGQCGTPLRADQSWCTLCYARVEDEFDPLTAPIEQLMEPHEAEGWRDSVPAAASPETLQPPVVDPRSDAPADSVEPMPVPMPAEPGEPEGSPEVTDVDVMLSMLAAEHRQGDPTSRWVGTMDDKATRIAVMAGGAVLIAAVGFLLLTLLGAIF
jgi:hypothetical protein